MTTTMPHRRVQARQILLDAIRERQGEWTTGRVKALYRKTVPTHMLRSVIRRHLRELTAAGHLEQHERNGRRYYTARPLACRRCGDTDGPFKGTTTDVLCEQCITTGGAW
jgi:hypothetical protein